MVLSVFGDARYVKYPRKLSGNKEIDDRVFGETCKTGEVRSIIEIKKIYRCHRKIFKDYTSIPITLMSEEEFEAKTKDPLKVKQARQIMTAMLKPTI